MLAGSASLLLASYAVGKCSYPSLAGALSGDTGRRRQVRDWEVLARNSVLSWMPTCPGVSRCLWGCVCPRQRSG